MGAAAVSPFTGVLLAAGRGPAVNSSGEHARLLQRLDDGTPVAVAAARRLRTVLPHVVAVVRPGCELLAQQLQAEGCRVCVCDVADEGIAAPLVQGVNASLQSEGWVIALADMPWVEPATIAALVDAVDDGAQIAVPTCQGQRGNPVAFGRGYLPELLALRGDADTGSLLATWPVTEIDTDDGGIRRCVDSPAGGA